MSKRQFGPPRDNNYSNNNNNSGGNRSGQPDPDEIGIVWGKDGAKGKFYSGFLRWQKICEILAENGFKIEAPDKPDDQIEDVRLIIFDTGNNGRNTRAPDLRIMKPKPRQQ